MLLHEETKHHNNVHFQPLVTASENIGPIVQQFPVFPITRLIENGLPCFKILLLIGRREVRAKALTRNAQECAVH